MKFDYQKLQHLKVLVKNDGDEFYKDYPISVFLINSTCFLPCSLKCFLHQSQLDFYANLNETEKKKKIQKQKHQKLKFFSTPLEEKILTKNILFEKVFTPIYHRFLYYTSVNYYNMMHRNIQIFFLIGRRALL